MNFYSEFIYLILVVANRFYYLLPAPVSRLNADAYNHYTL